MKRWIAFLLVAVLVCSMLSVAVFASSPEQGNTDVEVPPSSPQTGGLNIGWIIALAVVLCAVAAAAIMKLRKARS